MSGIYRINDAGEAVPLFTTGESAAIANPWKHIGSTAPNTLGWSYNEFWYDTTTESTTVEGVMRRWTPDGWRPEPAGSPSVGPLLFSDDFTGLDGAVWDATKWGLGRNPTQGTGGGATLLANGGRLSASNYGNYAGQSLISRRPLISTQADVNIEHSFRWDDSNGFYAVHARHSITAIDRKDGYALTLDKEINSWNLAVYDGNYVGTTLGSDVPLTWVPGTWYRLRFYCVGTAIKGKVWEAADPEPGTWDVEVTDSTYTSAGYVGVSLAGAATSSLPRNAYLDDFIVRSS